MDEHVAPAVTHGWRLRAIDVTTPQETSLLGASDEVLLTYALAHERVIFSQDEDFLVLHQQGKPHAGITYAPQQTPIGDIVRGLLLIHDVLSAEEMRGHLEFI